MKKSSQLPTRSVRLENLRKEKGFTQENVANKIGVTTKTYRTWEIGTYNGKSNIQTYPPIDNEKLEKLSELYAVSVDYILGLSDCRSIENNYISKKTGLTDDAIKTLEFINMKIPDNKEPKYIDILNYIMRDCDSFCDFLSNLDLYINNEYTTPLYYDEKAKKYVDCSYSTPNGKGVCFGKSMIDNKGNLGWAVKGVPTSILESHALRCIQQIFDNWKKEYKKGND